MQKTDALSLLTNPAAVTVAVIGDIMLDRFITGEVHRISPESPVPILKISHEALMMGGAGNVISNLCGLEFVTSLPVTMVGNDAGGSAVKEILQQKGVRTEFVINHTTRPTTLKTRFLAGRQQLLRTDEETASPVEKEIEDKFCDYIKAAIASADAVILSDYGKGVLTDKVIKTAIEAASAKNIPLLVDPKGSDYTKYKGADFVTPNRSELAQATNGMANKTDADIEQAAAKLLAHSGIKNVLATRSEDGMSLIGAAVTQPCHIKGDKVEVFDVSGAGDTVIAVMAAMLALKATALTASIAANAAGRVVVTKSGTAPILLPELKAALNGQQRIEKDSRIKPLKAAQDIVAQWKAQGLKIGFTNGCFDILHAGHVSYLNEARRHCDRLIMALNTDQSVRLLKGPERPINNEESRAAVLLGLSAIDMVVLFGADKAGDDNTPKAVIAELKPDIYFKGGDYTRETLPETPVVESYGGEVKIIRFLDGHSTTNIVEKIRA